MSEKFDVVVIGAGPGGYVAAIKSAKLGMKTAVIEEREVGGTCLNRGCIPAKAMIHASTLYREIKEADRFGISASDVTYDFEKILEYKEQTTGQLVQGVEQLLQANGVTRYYGKGTLFEGKKVKITGNKPVKAGKKLKLKAKITATKKANTKLLWTSANTKYATVNAKGIVTTKKSAKGKTVKIIAMATDGSGKKHTVKIKIK